MRNRSTLPIVGLIVLFTVLLCMVAAPAIAKTSGTVELYFQPDNSASHPAGWVCLHHSFDKYGLGIQAFGFMMEGWGELRVGPTWAPKEWVQLGMSVGVEFIGTSAGARFGSFAWFGYKTFSFLGTVEFNPRSFQGDNSGTWFDLNVNYQPFSWLVAGVKYRRSVGLGPVIGFYSPTSPSVGAWCAWMPVDPERGDGDLIHLTRFLVGVQARF